MSSRKLLMDRMLRVQRCAVFDFANGVGQLAVGMFFEKSEVAQLGKRE
jgi:hypothetical protein